MTAGVGAVFPFSLSLAASAPGGSGGSIHELLLKLGVNESTAHTAQVLTIGPARIVVILLVATVVNRLVPRTSRRLVRSLQLHAPTLLTSSRAESRAKTVGAVLVSVFRTTVWLIAFLTILANFGINLGPFVATATVIGAAVGFGAQSLVKDFLSGILILLEDQYGVGDSIVVDDVTGTVEGLNLRTTRVRSLDGMVWYIANGEVRKVANSSDGYNRAIVDVVLPPGTDLPRAEALAREEADALASEPDWRETILEPPSVLGVQAVAADGVTIRLLAKTVVGEHFRVARTLRGRIIERLRSEGVAWNPPPPGPPPPDPEPPGPEPIAFAPAPAPATEAGATGPASPASGGSSPN